MDVNILVKKLNSDFYTGVPDSQLKALCDYLIDSFEISEQHIIAANEGNSVALAAGYYLATGKIPVVYMQNSGIGNIINPVVSLLNEKVYGIPCIFIIGWRGEPEVDDEPQHIFQGEISRKLLEEIGLYTVILNKNTLVEELEKEVMEARQILKQNRSVAFLVRRNSLSYDKQITYENSYVITRESAIEHIINIADQDVIVSTTGKASREVFEIREKKGQGHQFDFLTVGSMGHSSSIALGIALNKQNTKVWCIDGDGAMLMHMGAMAVIGNRCPENLVHIVINNEAHESVGGLPTVSSSINLEKIAEGCGYPNIASVETYEKLDKELFIAKKRKALSFIEIKCAIGSREDLGRPKTMAYENKEIFMKYLKSIISDNK